jgi:hypothetical protein
LLGRSILLIIVFIISNNKNISKSLAFKLLPLLYSLLQNSEDVSLVPHSKL